MVNEINGNLVILGRKGRFNTDLAYANMVVSKFFREKLFTKGEFDSHWENYSTLYQGFIWDFAGVGIEKRFLPEIKVYDFPKDEGTNLNALDIPEGLNESKIETIAKVSLSLPVSLRSLTNKDGSMSSVHEEEVLSCKKMYYLSQQVYKNLKEQEKNLTKSGKIGLLFDNGHRIFTPAQFKGYIRRNGSSYGVTGHLLED